MSQHVSTACDEGTWVPLIEYSIKSGLSLSTIRRKIKSNSIPYRLDKGKYLILFSNDAGQNGHTVETRQSVEKQQPVAPRQVISPRYTDRKLTPLESEDSFSNTKVPYRAPKVEESSSQLVSNAFERLLDEKDARMRQLEKRNQELEARVNELQLLIKVLEEKYDVRY